MTFIATVYGENPFAGLGGKKFRVEDAKPVFVFDAASELRLLQLADDWSFPFHFLLAKTGLRVGELVHLLVEDVDLEGGWLQIRNKPELGWRIKTGCERKIPLVSEAVAVLRRLIGGRTAGPVYRKERYEPANCALGEADRRRLAAEVQRRIAKAEQFSREGRRELRAVWVQIAHLVARDKTKASQPLRSWVNRVAKKRGKKTALVALARRLLVIADRTRFRRGPAEEETGRLSGPWRSDRHLHVHVTKESSL